MASDHSAGTRKNAGGASRIAGIDIARGVAIYLMIQSHTVKGLLYFKDMPAWGVVPMHTITKISSSLFVIVFGITLGVIFLPRTQKPNWTKTRNHLWWRALMVLFWYKLLIPVQMFQLADRYQRWPDVVDMLLYVKFPDFVEILDFYSWILLILPPLLPLWRRLPLWAGPLIAAGFAMLGQLLTSAFDWGGILQLKAMMVEHNRWFCYGVFTRGPLAMLGIFLGDILGRAESFQERRKQLATGAIILGMGMLIGFFLGYSDNLIPILTNMAKNHGKHPPELFFTLFSVGGSMVILGACLFITRGPLILKPLEILGRESLVCFNTHIIVIFVGLRWLLQLKRWKTPMVSYPEALVWVGVVSLICIVVASLNTERKRRQRSRQKLRAAIARVQHDKELRLAEELERQS